MRKHLLPLLSIFSLSMSASAQGAWTPKANFAGTPRAYAACFTIGSKAYVGSGGDFSNVTTDLWEFDPSANVWTQKANFGGFTRMFAVGFSIGTDGYIGLGGDGYISSTAYRDLWKYNSLTNSWNKVADYGGVGKGHNGNAISFVINSMAYVGSGNDSTDNLTSDFWKYDPSTNSWSQTASSPIPNCAGAGFAIGTKGYMGTGHGLTNDFWQYDSQTNMWTKKADMPTAAGSLRYHATGFSIGTKGYFFGGYDGYYEKDLYEYDQQTDSWTIKSPCPGPGRMGAVGFALNGKAYIGTGEEGVGVLSDFWEFDPNGNGISESNHPDQITISTLGNGQFSINSNDLRMSELEIYSIKGEKVLTLSQPADNRTNLDLSGKIDGVYILKIKTNRGIATKKVMVI